MAVAADEAAVEADIAHIEARHGVELCGDEVLLRDAVAAVEDAHDGQLHAVAAVVRVGHGADEDVQVLAGDGLCEGFFHLVGGQVRQQIVDHQLRVVLIAADDHIHDLAVLLHHHAVQLQGDGRPLVLLDAAVVVRLEIGHLRVLIEGDLLQVKARGIDVRGGDDQALGGALLADDGQHQRLAAVGEPHLVACFELHAGHVLHETLALGQRHGLVHGLALRARVVQIGLVALAVAFHLAGFLAAEVVVAVFRLVKELVAVVFLFFHFKSPF